MTSTLLAAGAYSASRAHAKQALLHAIRFEVAYFSTTGARGLSPALAPAKKKSKCYITQKKRGNLHVAPAPPYIQRSLRSPLLAKRSSSTPPRATSPPPTGCFVPPAAHADPPPEAGPRTRGPPLELAELSSSGLRLGIEGPDLLQADEAPREGLRVAAGYGGRGGAGAYASLHALL